MMTTVIVDDVEAARRSLAEDLARYCPEAVLVGEASGVASGAALIERVKPALVLLDIQLADGSGFDMLERIAGPSFKLIFTTASDAYGIHAVKHSAIDYLLKPIDPDDLVVAVRKAAARGIARDNRADVHALLEEVRGERRGARRITLNTADRVYIVPTAEIVRCESHGNYTLFHLIGKRQIVVTRTLKEFEESLAADGFVRVHHSHLINIECVKEYVKGDGGFAVMSDGSRVPVAVRKKDLLLRSLGIA